jgi:peptidoglycan/xylan/chitin deacetylase (PgdA/CDA1 family)
MDRLIAQIAAISPLTAMANALVGPYVTIYMLHRPAPQTKIYNGVAPDLLAKCLDYAQHKFAISSLDELVQMAIQGEKPKRPTLCFTMDDGYLDQLTELTPIFLKYNAKPTIFVLSDFSDNIDWPWDAKLIYLCHETSVSNAEIEIEGETIRLNLQSQEDRVTSRRRINGIFKYLQDQKQDEYLELLSHNLKVTIPKTAPKEFAPADWESLRHYRKLGLNIGAHGRTHKVFNTLSEANIIQELTQSKERLMAEVPDTSNVYCYSSGTAKDYSKSHCVLVSNAGFDAAVSAEPGNTNLKEIKQDLFNIKRHGFPSKFEEFVRYSSWIEYIRSKVD